MNRWVVRQRAAAEIWIRDAAERLAARTAARHTDDGQTSFEYLGIAVVIAVIIGVLASTTSIGDAVLNGILGKITDIVGAGG